MSKKIISEQADIETSSENYTTRFSGKVGDYFLDVQKNITLKLLAEENVNSILDVGGGHAQLAVPLIENGYAVTVTGSDISCKNRLDMFLNEHQYTFTECNYLDLPYDDNSFDAVICFRLLTHEKNWKILIKEMCRVSKGVVIIDYPDIRSFNVLYKFMFEFKKRFEKNTRTFRSFSRKELKKEYQKYNFDQFDFNPQFFLPMVVHRWMKKVSVTKFSEKIFMVSGLLNFFGTPVILKVTSKN